jgi:O-antigen/teichoic acid export membrane protein
MMAGYPHYSAINEAIKLAIVVAGNLLLIPTYGLLGAIWSVAASIIIVDALKVIQVWWHMRVHPFSKQLWKVATASIVMVIVMQLWKLQIVKVTSDWYVLVLGALLATLLFGLTVVIAGLESEELRLFRTLMKRFDRSHIPAP